MTELIEPAGDRDPSSGDPTSGDPTSGDPTSGDPTSGDPTSGDPTSGDPPAGRSAGDPSPEGGSTGDPAPEGVRSGGEPAGDRDPAEETETDPATQAILDKPKGLWRTAMRRLLRRKGGVVGLVIIGVMLFAAIFAPLIAPYDPTRDFIGEGDRTRRDPPCVHLLGCDESKPQHIMGLDGNARDLFSRVVYGARVSLSVGFTTVLLAFTVGSTLGAIAGYWGRWADNGIMRLMDVILGFPALLLAIAIVAALGPGLRNTLLAIAVVSIPAYARVMRASVLSIKELDFVAASQALGGSKMRILRTRVIPNALTPLVVIGTLGVATAILDAAAFGFLGLGAQEPTAEWGSMLARERNQIFSAPHLVFFPGLAIMITVLGFNLLGDGLRDALDPSLNE